MPPKGPNETPPDPRPSKPTTQRGKRQKNIGYEIAEEGLKEIEDKTKKKKPDTLEGGTGTSGEGKS